MKTILLKQLKKLIKKVNPWIDSFKRWLFEKVNPWVDSFKRWLIENANRVFLYMTLFLLSVIGTWFTYNFAIDFSVIPITLVYILIFFAFFELFDKKILIGINTIHELNQGNQAVAQFYIAIAILLLSVAVMVG